MLGGTSGSTICGWVLGAWGETSGAMQEVGTKGCGSGLQQSSIKIEVCSYIIHTQCHSLEAVVYL
eukprot:1160149-Pelagomonas_calceolata.AAC.6